MKNAVKTLALITIVFLFVLPLRAQLKWPAAGGVAADLLKVLNDYPSRFSHLMGEMISEQPQSTDYRCNFRVSGAEESFFTRYSSQKESCSWEALMLTTESFDKAKKEYKNLFSRLNNLNVPLEGAGTCRLKGNYESPEEEKKFSAILLSLEPAREGWSKLRIEVALQYEAPLNWKVKLLVYDRERNDNERGKTKEGSR